MNTEYFGEYRIDDSFVEHGCCWDSAIVRDCTEGRGMRGGGVAMICECDTDMADVICSALNATLTPNVKVTGSAPTDPQEGEEG